jgi:hypothetical protein
MFISLSEAVFVSCCSYCLAQEKYLETGVMHLIHGKDGLLEMSVWVFLSYVLLSHNIFRIKDRKVVICTFIKK